MSPKEKKLAVQILDALETDWKPARYHDTYEEQLHDVIAAKKKGTVFEVEEEEPSARVLDLMEALQASLDSAAGRKRSITRTAAKQRPAREEEAPGEEEGREPAQRLTTTAKAARGVRGRGRRGCPRRAGSSCAAGRRAATPSTWSTPRSPAAPSA